MERNMEDNNRIAQNELKCAILEKDLQRAKISLSKIRRKYSDLLQRYTDIIERIGESPAPMIRSIRDGHLTYIKTLNIMTKGGHYGNK